MDLLFSLWLEPFYSFQILLRFGETCSFAHGIGELRQKPHQPYLMNSMYPSPISPLSSYDAPGRYQSFGYEYPHHNHGVNQIGIEG